MNVFFIKFDNVTNQKLYPMKKYLLLIVAATISISMFAQQTTRTLNWDGTDRQYIEYVPTSYTGDNPTPVIFCLHGLGDDMTNFSSALALNAFGEASGWLIITPQALMAQVMGMDFGTAWNSGVAAYGTVIGDVILNENVDDSGFLTAVLDSLENNLNINTDSIFFMGFSMGGFMCNRMALEHGDRITAIASVSGTIGASLTPAAFANVNALHIHGDADTQVTYDNADFDTGVGVYSVGTGALETVEYWRNYNNCDVDPIVNIWPDTQADGKTFERYVYLNGDNDSYVAHIKVIGGDHEWYYTPQNDMDYSTEIYKFFTNTMDFSVGITNSDFSSNNITLYPNPARNFIHVVIGENETAVLRVYDILGSLVKTEKVENHQVVDLRDFPEGMYIFRFLSNNKTIDKKIMVTR